MLTISCFPIQQVFRVLRLNDFVSPPRKSLGNMRTETLKTSSDNNMYLPSPVSGEFTFSKVVVSSWNLTWMKSKRERYIYICIFLFAEMWKTSPVQRYRKESTTCRNEAQFAAQPHSKPSECTNVHNLVWRKKLISYFDVPFDSVCYTVWTIRKWKKQTDIYHIQSLIYKRNLTHTELLLATLFLNVIIRYVVILIIIITFHL